MKNRYLFFYSKAEWIIPVKRPPDEWPQSGNINFKDFDLRYREGLPLVLKQVSCVITPGEKVSLFRRSMFLDKDTDEARI